MKNIAIFVSTLGMGGAEKQAALLANVLTKSYEVHFVVLKGDYEESETVKKLVEKSAVHIHLLSGGAIGALIQFAKILKDNKVEVSFNYLTQCDFLGSIVEKKCGVKQIYNGIRNSYLEGWKTILERLSHNHIANATIFNCYSGKEFFIRCGLKADKCVTIPNCFPNIEKIICRREKERKIIITIGRFVPQKDYETAIKTMAELKKMRKDFLYFICGYGMLEESIYEWIKRYDVGDVVEVHINPTNIPELLEQADVYFCTSFYEGTSNSIMEAMNWSLPIVATNVGDNNRLVLEGKNGMLLSAGDAEGLALSIDKLLENVEMRNAFGKTSNQILEENYSIEIFERRYLNLIERKGL